VLPRVVEKIREDQARIILVCPDWQRDLWWKSLQDLVVDKIFFPKGQKIFRAPGRNIGGTQWGVWAYLLDGEKGRLEGTLVFSVKEGGEGFLFPNPILTEGDEKLRQRQKVWGTPFSEKELWNAVEENDEEGDTFEFEVSSPSVVENQRVRAFQARTAEETEEDRVEELRKKIYEDYEGSVLDTKVPRDPPSRGPFGTAHIYLKPGAQPTRQKVYTMFGEKLEAHTKVTQEWVDNGYIEPVKGGAGKAGWLSMTFSSQKRTLESGEGWWT